MNQSKGKARSKTSRPGVAKRAQQQNNSNRGPKPRVTNTMRQPTLARGVGGTVYRNNAQVGVAAAYATGQSTKAPRISQSSTDSSRIIHRELVGSVVGTVLFSTGLTFNVNPGLSSSFPWLATQALGWEKYRFNSLKLCYYTRTGSNTPGSVILSPDYDAADSAPVNEQIASAYHGTQEDVAWKDNCLTFDPRLLRQERFIRTGGLGVNLDIKTYDIANVFVSTLDGTAVNWGKVWFEYDITLINQQLNSSGPSGNGTIQNGGGSVSSAAPFGITPITLGSYSLSCPLSVMTWSGLNIGSEYQLQVNSVGTVITGYTYTALLGATAGAKSSFNGFPTAATTGAMIFTFIATANTGGVTLQVTATTITATNATLSALVPTPGF